MTKQKRADGKDHIGRADLLKALERGKRPQNVHFKNCQICQDEWEILKMLNSSGPRPQLEEPSTAHKSQLSSIPILKSRPRKREVGQLTYDSWAGLSGVQLRDAARGCERRLRLQAGGVELEIVAERELSAWRFSARVYRGGEPVSGYVLKIGKRVIVPEFRNCFFWTSTTPPRTLHLWSQESDVVLKNIKWQGV